MKKQIQEYLNKIRRIIDASDSGTDWDAVLKEHIDKILFYQHERLIHLIVTALFAVMEIISITACFIIPNMFFVALSCLLLILLIPYVFHYYFLENSVQELYILYDKIKDMINGNG